MGKEDSSEVAEYIPVCCGDCVQVRQAHEKRRENEAATGAGLWALVGSLCAAEWRTIGRPALGSRAVLPTTRRLIPCLHDP